MDGTRGCVCVKSPHSIGTFHGGACTFHLHLPEIRSKRKFPQPHALDHSLSVPLSSHLRNGLTVPGLTGCWAHLIRSNAHHRLPTSSSSSHCPSVHLLVQITLPHLPVARWTLYTHPPRQPRATEITALPQGSSGGLLCTQTLDPHPCRRGGEGVLGWLLFFWKDCKHSIMRA